MNHLKRKFNLSGGGKKPKKPKPAILNPPKLGIHQLASSFSYVEILDLISDGPIEGLVNANNSRVEGINSLQGIYMDDTPIAVTDDNSIIPIPPINGFSDTSSLKNELNTLGSSILNSTIGRSVYTPIVSGTSVVYRNEYLGTKPAKNINSAYLGLLWSRFSKIETEVYINNLAKSYFVPHLSFGDKVVTRMLKTINGFYGFKDLTFSSVSKPSPQQVYINSLVEPYKSTGVSKALEFINTFQNSALIIDADVLRFDAVNSELFLDSESKIRTDVKLGFKSPSAFPVSQIYNFSYPKLTPTGLWNGRMGGFLVLIVNGELSNGLHKGITYEAYQVKNRDLRGLIEIEEITVGEPSVKINQKYNYSNILTEIKTGEESQEPFRFFNKVFIDKNIGSELFGPFITKGEVQAIVKNNNVLNRNYTLNDPINAKIGLPVSEGSKDIRNSKNYSDWDKGSQSFDESAIPVTHIIENPNVDSIFISLQVSELSDTAHLELASGSDRLDIGSKFPCVLNISIEVGKILADGVEKSHYTNNYQIIALVESPTIIDIGNPDSETFEKSSYKYIRSLDSSSIQSTVFKPFVLPPALDLSGETNEETPVKRYVRVTRLSTETNSTLINKEVSLSKVTEIIPVNCTYPFSAIIGVKADSRTFNDIPTRTYDARLKKIKIPSNYFPIKNNIQKTDKRYYNSKADYQSASLEDKTIYIGDWNGTFKTEWSDNPAWVLYDLLTSKRYGLGQYIDEADINKWDLYKIARFCDSVDENGVFIGVPDGRGGVEPRYSCNILFQEGTKVFDAINIIASLFRGAVYYNNNEINFLDDRLREPVALFSNSNVKDGLFSYSNYRRDEQFNAIEVIYIDRFDNFKTKMEYVEDEEDILQRGEFKKQVNALGVTSKAMANRIGRHLIYQTIKENQSVLFTAGLETLLCKPGDLIIIEDELKSLQNNFGRVLGIDSTAKTIRINDSFNEADYTSGVTIYSPTGDRTSLELEQLASSFRERLTGFYITGSGESNSMESFTGGYSFSGYSFGFEDEQDEGLFNQYAVYTGNQAHTPIIYYSTSATGWVFATGQAFTNSSVYNKWIAPTGAYSLKDVNTGVVNNYITTSDNRGATQRSISGVFDSNSGEINAVTNGLLDSEIQLNGIPQITTLSITGVENKDFGCLLYVDPNDINANILPFIPEGSAYRIQRKNADDQVYKILSISEENSNEYSVVANKYNSGKFDLIENSISFESQADTFGYGVNSQVNNVNYVSLEVPELTNISIDESDITGVYISGAWNPVTNATGYNVILRYPNLTQSSVFVSSNSYVFDSITNVGSYMFAVNALGDNNNSLTQRFFDSDYATTGVGLLLTSNMTLQLANSAINNFKLQ
jgi:hypothetical protein